MPRARLFGVLFTLLPVSVFALSSLRHETKLNWTGPAWLAALPFMAASMMPRKPGSIGRIAGSALRLWKPVILILLLAYGAVLHHVVLGLPGTTRALAAGMGWRELARQVEAIEAEVLQQTGTEPLIVGMDKYNIASELAFYDPVGDGALETTSKNLFGKRGLMYDYWFPPEEQAGKDLVLVSDDLKTIDAPAVKRAVAALEPIRPIRVEKDGGFVAEYFARVAHGYRGAGEVAGGRVPARR